MRIRTNQMGEVQSWDPSGPNEPFTKRIGSKIYDALAGPLGIEPMSNASFILGIGVSLGMIAVPAYVGFKIIRKLIK